MTRTENKKITVKDWFANKVATEISENFQQSGKIKKATKQLCSDLFKINYTLHQSVTTAALKECSKFADTFADIRLVRSFGLMAL